MNAQLSINNTRAQSPSLPAPGTARYEALWVVGAPVWMLLYGLTRYVDGRDGQYGPGPVWVVGHLFFLFAMISFGGALFVMRSRILSSTTGRAAPLIATMAAVAGALGVLAFARVIIVDILVGLHASNNEAMDALDDRYDERPVPVPEVVHLVGPMMFMIGLLLLLVWLTTKQTTLLRWWCPIVAVVGFVSLNITLDLLPLAAFCFGFALIPLLRNRPDIRERAEGPRAAGARRQTSQP